MGKYSIKDLEQLSGVKAHTLRIWEKRYKLLKPERTDTNIRFYNDDELRKLLNVTLLYNKGEKISKVASYDHAQLLTAVKEIEDHHLLNRSRVDDLTMASLVYDSIRFSQLYDQFVEEIGIERTFVEVLLPFLERVGLLWLSEEMNPSQEHLISNLIRQKIIHAIEQLPNNYKKSAILFLPEGEYHELGLLFFSYLFKKHGFHVYYLGASVPIFHANELSSIKDIDIILTYSVLKGKEELESFFTHLKEFKSKEIYFIESKNQTGYLLKYPKNISKLKGYEGVLQLIKP
ncbi:MAG: helix-turn-helix-type transcriptional regulator [Verrucomicrobia bacterium]|nr:helix-turn-helix-type transcriptional regulator [Verrucomicrobiota bacterium]